MPFISNEAMEKVKHDIEKLRKKARKGGRNQRYSATDYKVVARTTVETVGAAAVAGYVRGRFEKAGKSCEFMGVDLELAAGLALMALPMMAPMAGLKLPAAIPASTLQNAGLGMFAHYAGQVSRNYAKTDELRLVAGNYQGTAEFVQNSGESYFQLPRPNDMEDSFGDFNEVGSLAGLHRATR